MLTRCCFRRGERYCAGNDSREQHKGDIILENTGNRGRQNNNYPKPGDILAVSRGLYYHYGVYAGRNRVIHYTSNTGDFGEDIYVHETTVNRFLRGGRCLICRFSDKYRKPGLGAKFLDMIRNPNLFTVMESLSAFLTGFSGSSFHLYSGKETVEHARSRLGENKYNLVFNNCEHFAVWCKTGISESSQVSAVLSLLAAVSAEMIQERTE
jgi:cell wall-associated NlpC family hydrolase